MPPCFPAACAKSDTASKDNTAAASACTLRMFPSLDGSASFGPIISNDTMTGRGRNQQGPVSILVLRTNAKLSQKLPQEDPSPPRTKHFIVIYPYVFAAYRSRPEDTRVQKAGASRDPAKTA